MRTEPFSIKLGKQNKTILSNKSQEIFLDESQMNDLFNLQLVPDIIGLADPEIKKILSDIIYDVNNASIFRDYFQKNMKKS